MDPELSYASKEMTPEHPPQSFLNRVGGVFFSPGETFKEIGRAPRVALPLIVFLLFTAAVGTALSTRGLMERSMNERLDQAVESGRVTAEQAERQREQTQKMLPIIKAVAPVMAVIWWSVILLFTAGAAKLVSMLLDVENDFKPLLAVATYSLLVTTVVSGVLFLALIYVKPIDEVDLENPLSSNLGALISIADLGTLPKFLKVLLSYVDVFYIWKLFLLSTGMVAVSKKLKFSTALIWTIAFGLLVALIHAAGASLFG